MDQQNPRRESVNVREGFATADPAPQRFEGLHEFQIGIGGAMQRPALAEQTPAAVVLGRDFQPDRACGFLGDRNARWRDPHAWQRTAKTRIFQRLTGRIAILAVTDQQKFKASGPVGQLRIIDMLRRGIEGLPPLLYQTVETVAADL